MKPQKYTWALLADCSTVCIYTQVNHLKNGKPLTRAEALKEAYRLIRKKYKNKVYKQLPFYSGKENIIFDIFSLNTTTIDEDGNCTDVDGWEYINKNKTSQLITIDKHFSLKNKNT